MKVDEDEVCYITARYFIWLPSHYTTIIRSIYMYT